jgi:hypothetical protein
MMITVSELEAIIAHTPSGEQVQYEGKPIGSVDHVTRKLTELKLKRSSDPDYLIFVGIDRFGECFLAAFSTMGDPREFRARYDKQLDRAAEGLLPPRAEKGEIDADRNIENVECGSRLRFHQG